MAECGTVPLLSKRSLLKIDMGYGQAYLVVQSVGESLLTLEGVSTLTGSKRDVAEVSGADFCCALIACAKVLTGCANS